MSRRREDEKGQPGGAVLMKPESWHFMASAAEPCEPSVAFAPSVPSKINDNTVRDRKSVVTLRPPGGN